MSFLSLSRFSLYAAIFSVVIVSGATFFPFITGKAVFFKIAVGLALIFYLLSLAFENQKLTRAERRRQENKSAGNESGGDTGTVSPARLLKSPLVIAVSVFVLVFLLAGFFGINPSYSFWSNFERGEGGFQMLHYFAFFILLVLTMRTKKDWQGAFYASFAAAALMIFYGIAAWLKIEGFIGPAFAPENRFQGSLGNPAYVGAYLIFIFSYIGIFLMEEKDGAKKLMLYALGAFFFVFFMLAQTRGAFLGLIAGTLAALAYLAWTGQGRARTASIALLALIVVTGALAIAFRKSEFVDRIPGGRVFDINVSERTFQTRLWAWETAIKGWQERPVFGWGPENFSAVFDKHFDTRHYTPEIPGVETWFDRAHSVYFDYLAQTGAAGLLAYLSIFAVFYVLLFQRKRAQNAVLFAVPVAYLVQGVALFDVLPIYLNLFLFLAFANYKMNFES